MSAARRLATALVMSLAVVGLSPGSGAGAAGPRPLRLTLAFTADVSGYLEPCG